MQSIENTEGLAARVCGSRSAEVAAFVVIATTIFALRSWHVAHLHSPTIDTEYHFRNGMKLLTGGSLVHEWLDGPASGSAVAIVPAWLTRLFGVRLGLQDTLELVAVWKSLLLVPMLGVAFAWARSLYGRAAAWWIGVALCFEPTLAGHTPYVTTDTIGTASIVVALAALWRYVERPSLISVALAALLTAVALSVKQNAAVLAPVTCCWIVFHWRLHRPSAWPGLGKFASHVALGSAILFFALWACVGFDVSPGVNKVPEAYQGKPFVDVLTWQWPAGLYLRSLVDAAQHAQAGHPTFLLGEQGKRGWWSYFVIVATYKIPIGLVLLYLTACFSKRVRRCEVPLLIAFVWMCLTCFLSTIQIGFRHALPAIVLGMILAGRVFHHAPKWRAAIGQVGILLAALHVSIWHPNYLSYVNFPRDRAWMDISDSNIDWGQALLQARDWATVNAESRPVTVLHFGMYPPSIDPSGSMQSYLGSRVRVVEEWHDVPDDGLLIVSPVRVTSQFHPEVTPFALWSVEPVAVVGNAMLVYDLDALRQQGVWPRGRPPTPASPSTLPARGE